MQPAIQHLFQVSALDSLSRERLEAFVEEYPCFGFGHYLLSQKLKAENADHFLITTQKTGLYFSNPFWLQWLLENSPATSGEAATPVKTDRGIPAETAAEPDLPIPGETATEPDLPLPGETATEPDPPIPAETAALSDTPIPVETATEPDHPLPAETAAELLLDSLERARELRESLIRMNEDFFSGSDSERPALPDQSQPAPLHDAPAQPAG
ncbi:MAG TPA: hypothetical protein VG052_06745, partial [Puia sp.]|nr:hypothetical protein [Puia sp.]